MKLQYLPEGVNSMDFKSMRIEDIISWCKANNQVAWLKEFAAKQIPYEKYPRKTVIREDGKKVAVADKTQPYTIAYRKPSFIEIKMAFVEKFMPEIAPEKKEAKPTMYDIIAAL